MDDAAFEALRAKRYRRRRRVQFIGFGLIGLIVLGILLAWSAPLIMTAREAARRRMLMRLSYPEPPSAPGVYPVTARPHPYYFRDIILSTPAMPVELSPDQGTAQLPAVQFEFDDYIYGMTRVAPPDHVSLTIYAPPRTWPVHRGHILALSADGTTARLSTSMNEYIGDGWGLKERDRLDFNVPTEFFVRMAGAKEITGALDGQSFRINADQQRALRDFAAYLRPGIQLNPPE